MSTTIEIESESGKILSTTLSHNNPSIKETIEFIKDVFNFLDKSQKPYYEHLIGARNCLYKPAIEVFGESLEHSALLHDFTEDFDDVVPHLEKLLKGSDEKLKKYFSNEKMLELKQLYESEIQNNEKLSSNEKGERVLKILGYSKEVIETVTAVDANYPNFKEKKYKLDDYIEKVKKDNPDTNIEEINREAQLRMWTDKRDIYRAAVISSAQSDESTSLQKLFIKLADRAVNFSRDLPTDDNKTKWLTFKYNGITETIVSFITKHPDFKRNFSKENLIIDCRVKFTNEFPSNPQYRLFDNCESKVR